MPRKASAGLGALVLVCAMNSMPACNSSGFGVDDSDASAGASGSAGERDGSGGTAGEGGTGGAAGDAGPDAKRDAATDARVDSATGGTSGDGGSDASIKDAGVDAGPSPPSAGLVLWLDASRIVGLTTGSKVPRWFDRSGNARHADQPSATLQPTFELLSGKPAVVFDGVDDAFNLPAGFDDFGQGLSVFMLIRPNRSNCDQMLQLSNGKETDDIALQFVSSFAFEYEIGPVNVRTGTDVVVPGENALVAVVHGMAVSGTTDAQLRVNGALAYTASNMALPPVVERSANLLGSGLYDGCSSYSGAMFEVLVYDRRLTGPERVAVESYLQTKWACCAL